MSVLFRKPQRISITVNHHLYELLLQCSDLQGRSVSNLAAFLLESALDGVKAQLAVEPSTVVDSSVNRGVGVQGVVQPLTMLQR
jgi:hypothetical protein